MKTILVLSAVAALASAAHAQTTTFNYTGSIQSWIVPTTGTYTIVATGANGGSTTFGPSIGGRGAIASGDLFLSAGSTLSILVGQRGANGGSSTSYGGGGGGGSFVALAGLPLIVAGGGGGIGSGSAVNGNGLTTTFGGNGSGGALGGINGLGGAAFTIGGGGGGFFSDGATAGVFPTVAAGGLAFINGGTGGMGVIGSGGNGGFGGGGGGGNGSAGGGGGYSGGGAGPLGGGGGSYANPSATNTSFTSGGNFIPGHSGQVTITYVIPAPGAMTMLAVCGVVAMRRRRAAFIG